MTPDNSRRSAQRYLRILTRPSPLASTRFSRPESTASAADELKDPAVRQQYLDRLSLAFIKADQGEKAPEPGLQQARTTVLRQADNALAKLARERTEAELTPDDRVGLEAVIRLTGRPSILIKNGDLDLDPSDPDLGPWQATIQLARDG